MAFILLSFCLCCAVPFPAYALDERQVDFEIKFLLDSDQVLTDEHLLTDDFRALIGAGTDYRSIDVIYLETEGRDFLNEGWVNRIRWKENKKKIECTCKKRYSLSGEDAAAIRAALAQAEADGFVFSDTAYSAQIDWGFSKMTLSAEKEVSGKYKDYRSLSQFSTADAIKFFEKTMPDEERDWGEKRWGAAMLAQAQKVGPLQYRRIKGSWEGTEADVEIWPMKDGYITELSFKVTGLAAASTLRERMTALLEEKGILLHEDSLKTQMILDDSLRAYPQEPDGIRPEASTQIGGQALSD
jgi:hypothetical protein